MIRINRHVFPNGLRLLHYYNATTQMVALNVLYDVGARDEEPHHTGLAHLTEHLMFTGSRHAPEFDVELERAGGSSNAGTTADITHFYETLPAHNAETAFWLEADRMAHLTLSQRSIDTQKSVVIEEFKQRYLNAPYGDVSHLLLGLAYHVHPYRTPTIGESPEHISHMPVDVIRRFYSSHYVPSNTILCVAGNISFDRALSLTQKWFGSMPSAPKPVRNLTPEPPQTSERVMEVERYVPQTAIFRAYRMCGATSPLYPATDLITDVLANGKSSRFYRNVVTKTGLFTSLDASVMGTLHPGLLLVTGHLAQGASVAAAQQAIDNEIQELLEHGISQRELEKCVNKYASNLLFETEHYLKKAFRISMYELMGDADEFNRIVDRYRAVTPTHVLHTAQTVLAPANCSTLIYRSSKR